MLARVTTLALVLLASCKKHDTGAEIVVRSETCIRCDAPRKTGELASRELDEISGLAASSTHDDVYFAHNDSGDSARFFAIDSTGKRLATFTFSHAPVEDCEDIARGPCDAADRKKSCIFVGDIGDNASSRHGITIYRVVEPETIADADVSSDAFPLVYPDGAHNAETLFVHPTTGVITIVTKVSKGVSGIYEAPMPLTPGVAATLKAVGTIASPAGSPRFTGGSVHPLAKAVLLRTYTHVYYAPMKAGQSVAEALATPLCSLPAAREEQGEAVAWTRAGDGFVTTSEGVSAPVSAVHCFGP